MTAIRLGPPAKQGLYDPQFEHDACGVGFVVDIKGRKSNAVVKQGIQILKNLDHRGASGSEVNTGDGAGILLQMPHAFLKKVAKKDARINLPEAGMYAAGNIFMPRNATQRRKIEEVFARVVQAEGQVYLGARSVPTDNSSLGETAKASEPFVRQVFIGRGPETLDEADFERKLYVIRKRAYNEIRVSTIGGAEFWYIVSLSHKTLVYKGMLTTNQLDQYFLDLQNPLMESAIALVHSRFSTNTFPSWDRAHPYRCIAHNGEINTLRETSTGCARARRCSSRRVRRRHQEDHAHHQSERIGFLDVRQRARAHGARRPLDAARRHDDDPRAVVQTRLDGSGAPRVLPVPQ
jgi:glutamate synthase (ferredoxin)